MRQYVKQIYKNTAFFARLYLKLEEDCKKTRKVKLFIFGLMKASPPTDTFAIITTAVTHTAQDF